MTTCDCVPFSSLCTVLAPVHHLFKYPVKWSDFVELALLRKNYENELFYTMMLSDRLNDMTFGSSLTVYISRGVVLDVMGSKPEEQNAGLLMTPAVLSMFDDVRKMIMDGIKAINTTMNKAVYFETEVIPGKKETTIMHIRGTVLVLMYGSETQNFKETFTKVG